MSEQQRRASDHPWERHARIMLGVIFGAAAIWFANAHAHIPMGVFLFACGTMLRVDLGGVLNKIR